MKRIVTLVILLVLSTALLTACGNNKNKSTTPTVPPTATQTPSATPAEDPTTAPNAYGDNGNSNLSASLPDLIEQIYEIKDPGLALATMEPDLTDADAVRVYTGLATADKLKSVAVSEARIGSQAYSLVLVRLNDAADAKEIAEAMKEGIDPRKWICVMADDIKVAACDDVVMFVMMDSEFKDFVTSTELTDAFRTICGGTFSVELN